MPLQHSSSPSAFKANVKTLMGEIGKSPHVKNRSQALAVAYSEKRRAKRASGGKVRGYDTGGATDPVSAVVSALQAGSNQVASPGSNPGMNASTPSPASFAAAAPAYATSPTAPTTPTQNNPAAFNSTPANTGLGTSNPVLQNQLATTTNNSFLAPQAVTAGVAPQPQPQAANNPAGMAFGGTAGVGQMPWFAKAEAKNLTHTGPIMSAVPGRTDRHNMNVASGSYVIPAESISHLGQSNTMAGMKIANNMFGASGPYGAGIPKMGHGAGLPKPPRAMGVPGDTGGARGEGTGTPVPVVTAGGEFVVSPEVVARIGGGDIKHGHKVLDAWIMALRKDHIKTLKGLKPPVKS
jgi:hypothetical protein